MIAFGGEAEDDAREQQHHLLLLEKDTEYQCCEDDQGGEGGPVQEVEMGDLDRHLEHAQVGGVGDAAGVPQRIAAEIAQDVVLVHFEMQEAEASAETGVPS